MTIGGMNLGDSASDFTLATIKPALVHFPFGVNFDSSQVPMSEHCQPFLAPLLKHPGRSVDVGTDD